MKTIIGAICSALLIFSLYSCEDVMGDFLDKAPGVDVTIDTIFSSPLEVEKFVAGMYEVGLHSIVPIRGTYHLDAYTMTAGITDEGEVNEGWNAPNQWNQGSITENGSSEDGSRWRWRWEALRRCNTLLENIDGVPGASEAYVNQTKGEALFIRADLYFEMLKRYGGVPILDHALQPNESFKIPRSSVKDVVDFIVNDCTEAASLLPSSYESKFRGRATKAVALALKSRTLLFAASPLFNSATPYLDFGSNNDLISYGNEDQNRWQLAADAAKAAIDGANEGGFSLVNDPTATNMNYRNVWEKNDNSEIILANKLNLNGGFWAWPTNGLIPKVFNVSWGGTSAPHDFVSKYEKQADGTPQTWNSAGGNDLLQKYSELDPRFYQTMAPVGSKWSNTLGIVESYVGGKHEALCVGVWVHKWASYDQSWSVKPPINNVLFRVAELYLNYAEALNEAQGPVTEAYEAVNIIRSRSGMPSLPLGLSKSEFRDRVRNERAVELAYEDMRLWDIRRWKIAEEDGVMSGEMTGVKTFKIPNSTEYRYEFYVFETRVFHKRMYLHPFPRMEVLKDYLLQNPGY